MDRNFVRQRLSGKSITLNSVIAQALNRGSLKEQYLVFRKDPSGAPVKIKKNVFLIYTV